MSPKSSKQSRTSRRLVSFLFLLCLTYPLSTCARAANPCAPPAFNTAPAVRLPVNISPASVVTADFNRDGRGDLAVTVQLNGGSVRDTTPSSFPPRTGAGGAKDARPSQAGRE
jgi:hypothetical protein